MRWIWAKPWSDSRKAAVGEYPFGTDKQGRDVLTRMMHGARISLAVSCLAILVGGTLGTGLGMLAAYRGGFLDAVLMRIVDIKLAFPSILLALTLVVAIGSGFSTVIVVIALLLWARYARVIRGKHWQFGNGTLSTGPESPERPTSGLWPSTFSPMCSIR